MPTALAGLALCLVATRIPDRILGTIPLPPGQHILFQRFDQSPRTICQHTGFGLAVLLSFAWSAISLFHFGTEWSQSHSLQFGLLSGVFVLHTLRSRHYLSGLCVSVLMAIGGASFVAGLNLPIQSVISCATIATAVMTAGGYMLVRSTAYTGETFSWDGMRRQLGLDLRGQVTSSIQSNENGGRNSWAHAFVVPLCDLSLILLTILAVGFHIPQLLIANTTLNGLMLPVGTSVLVVWLIAAARGLKSSVATVTASLLFPVWVTAIATTAAPGSIGYPMLPLMWSIAAAAMVLVFRNHASRLSDLVCQIADLWLGAIFLGCLFIVSWPLRAASAIALAGVLLLDHEALAPSRRTWLAIAANINLMLAAIGLTCVSGFAPAVLYHTHELITVAALMLPLIGMSLLFFDRSSDHFFLRFALPACLLC